MARILGIDYGGKRTGLAVTDPLQIIATSLTTVDTVALLPYLQSYLLTEEVEGLVIGAPTHKDGTPTALEDKIQRFIQQFKKLFPSIAIYRQDEAYTSYEAKQVILKSGVKKMKQRDKALVDKVSAVIILQQFMENRRS